jgi:hypothetical protein
VAGLAHRLVRAALSRCNRVGVDRVEGRGPCTHVGAKDTQAHGEDAIVLQHAGLAN